MVGRRERRLGIERSLTEEISKLSSDWLLYLHHRDREDFKRVKEDFKNVSFLLNLIQMDRERPGKGER